MAPVSHLLCRAPKDLANFQGSTLAFCEIWRCLLPMLKEKALCLAALTIDHELLQWCRNHRGSGGWCPPLYFNLPWIHCLVKST